MFYFKKPSLVFTNLSTTTQPQQGWPKWVQPEKRNTRLQNSGSPHARGILRYITYKCDCTTYERRWSCLTPASLNSPKIFLNWRSYNHLFQRPFKPSALNMLRRLYANWGKTNKDLVESSAGKEKKKKEPWVWNVFSRIWMLQLKRLKGNY